MYAYDFGHCRFLIVIFVITMMEKAELRFMCSAIDRSVGLRTSHSPTRNRYFG